MSLLPNTTRSLSRRRDAPMAPRLSSTVVYSSTTSNQLYRTGRWRSLPTAPGHRSPAPRSITSSTQNCMCEVLYPLDDRLTISSFELILRMKGNYLWPGMSCRSIV